MTKSGVAKVYVGNFEDMNDWLAKAVTRIYYLNYIHVGLVVALTGVVTLGVIGWRFGPAWAGSAGGGKGGQAVTWQSYVNEFDGYSVPYPQGWYVHVASHAGGSVFISNFVPGSVESADATSASNFKLDIAVVSNTANLTISDWVSQNEVKVKGGRPSGYVAPSPVQVGTVNGRTAFQQQRKDPLLGEIETWYLAQGQKIFILSYIKKPQFNGIAEHIIQGFAAPTQP